MSKDEHKRKSRNEKNYFHKLYINKLNKNNNDTNLMTLNTNNKSKIEDKKDIRYRNLKQLAIGPFVSTLESTVTSQKNENEEDYSKIPIIPMDEDSMFLYDIFFKTNCYKSKYFFNKEKSETNYIKCKTKNDNGNSNKYDFIGIKKYLIKLQKNFIMNENSLNENDSSSVIREDCQLQKLEDLITRYILIIHILIRCSKFNEARKLFLLAIKENFNYINKIENQIYLSYTERNYKINNNIQEIPESTYNLLKIYSLIIRYSRLFNINKYRNIFLSKYLKIQLLNLNFFMIKGKSRGFTIEIRNQINYIFSYCIHNAVYYCIQNYIPINIPLILNSSIISIYQNQDESYLTNMETSLLIKTLFNQGILYYVDNSLDEALVSLKHCKERIISFGDDFDTKNKKSGRSLFKKIKKENSLDLVKNKKKDSISSNNSNINDSFYPYNKRIDTAKIRTKFDGKGCSRINEIYDNINNQNISSRKISIISFDGKNSLYDLSQSSNNKYEKIMSKINANLKKDKISINDIEYLINFGKDNMLLNDDTLLNEKNLALFGRLSERYTGYKKVNHPIKGPRNSHINFHTSIKIKNFNIPEKFENPLLRDIELLMCLIELQRRKYEASFDHILKLFYLIIILKLRKNNNKYDKNFFNIFNI